MAAALGISLSGVPSPPKAVAGPDLEPLLRGALDAWTASRGSLSGATLTAVFAGVNGQKPTHLSSLVSPIADAGCDLVLRWTAASSADA